MKKRIAVVLVSFASIAGAHDARAAAIPERVLLRLDIVVEAVRAPADASPALPDPGDLKRLTRRDLDALREAGISPREVKRDREARLFKDRAGGVWLLPAVPRKGARPVSTGFSLR